MPGPVVVQGAQVMCAAGVAPAVLAVTSQMIVKINGMAVATTTDCVPGSNIPPFGICNLLTAAAEGVPTPCAMIPAGTWQPGSIVQKITGLPVLTQPATLQCGVGGAITIVNPGQVTETSN